MFPATAADGASSHHPHGVSSDAPSPQPPRALTRMEELPVVVPVSEALSASAFVDLLPPAVSTAAAAPTTATRTASTATAARPREGCSSPNRRRDGCSYDKELPASARKRRIRIEERTGILNANDHGVVFDGGAEGNGAEEGNGNGNYGDYSSPGRAANLFVALHVLRPSSFPPTPVQTPDMVPTTMRGMSMSAMSPPSPDVSANSATTSP